MKRLRQYKLPIFLAISIASLLVYFLIPPEFYLQVTITIAIPMSILGIGFRIITHRRIQIIRNQIYQITKTLEEFDIDVPQKIQFEESPFPLLNELNQYLIELVDRVNSNYQSNKQFTQNASHELQTPLAIIKGNAELLLQSPNIKKKETEAIAVILQNTTRLSKLNSTLILLSKIENKRYPDTELINFNDLIKEITSNFNDLIRMQKLEVLINEKSLFNFEMSETLAEILVANLIQNAIRHNTGNYIKIDIQHDFFRISNKGINLETSTDKLFKRFKRQSNVEESLGLGLSIVSRICNQYEMEVIYTEENGIHTIIIKKV